MAFVFIPSFAQPKEHEVVNHNEYPTKYSYNVTDIWLQITDALSGNVTLFLRFKKDSEYVFMANESVLLGLDPADSLAGPKYFVRDSFLLKEMDTYVSEDTAYMTLGRDLGDVAFVKANAYFRVSILFEMVFGENKPLVMDNAEIDTIYGITKKITREYADYESDEY